MTTFQLNSQQLQRVQQQALYVGLGATAICALCALLPFLNLGAAVLRSYLLAHLFWWGIAIGCLGLTILNHLVGGRWGYATRPIFTAGISTLPLLAVLFVPIAAGLESIYIWADAEEVAHDARLQHKSAYLDPWFFRARAAGYFLVWIGLGLAYSRQAVSQAVARPRSHSSGLSGLALVILVLTVSFAAMDWVMSLEPYWYSTIYGALIAAGGALTAMSLVVGVVAMGGAGPLEDEKNLQVMNDLASLLLAFIMIWSYFAFSQFLIIWSGNLPDEIRWYLTRLHGGWQWVAGLIVLFHFIVPFLLLLSHDRKRDANSMLAVVAVILVIHYVDLFWNVMPAFHASGFSVNLLDPLALLAVGGLWVALFSWQLRQRLPDYSLDQSEQTSQTVG